MSSSLSRAAGGRAADGTLNLPSGVSASDWELERSHFQDRRLRLLRSALEEMEELQHSDQMVLHSLAPRFEILWKGLEHLAGQIRGELSPLLRTASLIPAIESERSVILDLYDVLNDTVLARIPVVLEHSAQAKRRYFCDAYGRIESFLHNTMGRLVAADPRPLPVERAYLDRIAADRNREAHELRDELGRFKEILHRLEEQREETLSALREKLDAGVRPPDDELWSRTSLLLEELKQHTLERLTILEHHPGVRVNELGDLNRYVFEIPNLCDLFLFAYRRCLELEDHLAASMVYGRLDEAERAELLSSSQESLRTSLRSLARRIQEGFVDLNAFVSLWYHECGHREALNAEYSAKPQRSDASDD